MKIINYAEKEEQLKNPVLCYSVLVQFEREAGESLTDCGIDTLIDNDLDLLNWIIKKGYITQEKAQEIIDKNEMNIEDLLFGYETGMLNGECCFPSNNKAKQILAEYISEHEEMRKKIIFEYCTVFDKDAGDEGRCGCCSSYNTRDGKHTLASIIYDYDTFINTMSKKQWLNEKWCANISFTDEYNYLKNMSCEECDRLSEEDC